MLYWGEVKGAVSFLLSVPGCTKTETLISALCQLLLFADDHTEKLPLELVAVVPLFKDNLLNPTQYILKDMYKHIQDIFNFYLSCMCNKIRDNFASYVKLQLGKGGGKLF